VADPPVMEFRIILHKIISFFLPSRSSNSIESHSPYYSPSQPKGFSLVELLIIIAIVGILSIIAIFQVTPAMQRYRLTGAARLVWGDLQNAKMIALKTNSSVTVTFNSTTNYSFPQGGGTTFSRNLSTEYSGIAVTTTGGTITFTSNGQIPNASGGNITVTVTGPSGTKTITLGWTGSVVLN
jgi:prepilin-type N-terminal cleavage/methylation domain-containing protein